MTWSPSNFQNDQSLRMPGLLHTEYVSAIAIIPPLILQSFHLWPVGAPARGLSGPPDVVFVV